MLDQLVLLAQLAQLEVREQQDLLEQRVPQEQLAMLAIQL
jgi:hypothetical protein